MTRSLPTLALAAAITLLSGCAATVQQPTSAPGAQAAAPAAPIAAPSVASGRLVVLLTGPAAVMSSADWLAFREEWETSVGAAAAAAKVVATLPGSEAQIPADPAVLARVQVNDFRYVSQAKRYALGVMAGNAYMDLDVEFLDWPGKRLLGTRKYATTSSAWHGVFSAMTPKQVEAVSAEIVKTATGQ